MTKYKITIEFESKDCVASDLNKECDTVRDEFVESELYNLDKINVSWERV